MAFKKPYRALDTFSMSSMTDVIFLLLIFFMVTSTLIFPAAIDVNLPESSKQTSLKPTTEIYIDAQGNYWLVADRNDSTAVKSTPVPVDETRLLEQLQVIQQTDSTRAIALYADSVVSYGRVVNVLDMGARNNLRIVLATRAATVNPSQSGR